MFNDGLNFIQNLVEKDRLFFDIEGSRHTFSAMNAYKWNLKGDNPKPLHDWASHPCDAVRYAIYTHDRMSGVSFYS